MFEPKPLPLESVPAALEKAAHYRLLNDPKAAESICLDVLETDADNQEALITLLLALTDQFGGGLGVGRQRAVRVVERLTDEYDRAYYGGLANERMALVLTRQRGPRSRHLAHDGFRSAMEGYTKALELRPGDTDAILRWNTCARILNDHPYLVPEPTDSGHHLLE